MKFLRIACCSFMPLTVFLQVAGCSPASPSAESNSTNPPQTTKSLIQSVASNVIAPAYSDFADQAGALVQKTTAFATSPADTAALTDAQQAWKNTMSSWQRIEVLQLGPAASSLKSVGGQNIRDEIYSWPTVKPCRIDQEIAENVFPEPEYFNQNLVNSYGLDAIEYLLFNDTFENQCSTGNSINANGTWEALSETEITARRALFSKILATQILSHAQDLKESWLPPDGEYYTHFTNPGASSPYENHAKALNELYAALFYIDLIVKDDKLGVPAGLMSPCDNGTPCPTKRESVWANYSKEEIIANLESFQRAFSATDEQGVNGIGFDDLLADQGEQGMADTIQTGIAGAIAKLKSLNTSLQAALESELTTVQEAYESLKTATDKLKNEFAEVLALEVPQEGAGDND